MGRRFEEFKSRMRSQAQIGEIENGISDHEAFLATSADTHATRMLKGAVDAMKQNLADLKQNHDNFFHRGRTGR